MAKQSMSIAFKNAMIDKENDLITETSKDEVKYYKLSEIIDKWNHIEGVSITIKKEDDLEPIKDIDNEGNEE